ncbi:Hypothetical protein CINCED_3A021863 [Cinara cedri]|nr:Hypothetical protein CINCED_3A021863 [Cinara cedri]
MQCVSYGSPPVSHHLDLPDSLTLFLVTQDVLHHGVERLSAMSRSDHKLVIPDAILVTAWNVRWAAENILNNIRSGTPGADKRPDSRPEGFPSRIKSALKGIRFESMEEMKQKSAELLNGLTKTDFQHCLEQWKKRMKRCVARGGEYIEGEYLNVE